MKDNNKKGPFIHLFKNILGYYLYDVNTDRIIEIPKDVYDIICEPQYKLGNNIAINDYIENLKNDGLLKEKRVIDTKHKLTDYTSFYLKNKLNHLTLQVTQSCNLMCGYCVYSGKYNNRKHSSKQMTFQTAQKSIDYLFSHSKDSEWLFFSFYGGEPLVAFETVKQCVDYIENIRCGRNVMYAMTTNATLLNNEIMDFWVKYDFNVLISLDGPEEIHNKHRKFAANGKGSFDAVVSNVFQLRQRYPEYYKRNVSFNMVLDPENEYRKIDEFLTNSDLFRDVSFSASIIDERYTNTKNKVSEIFYVEQNYSVFLMMLEKLNWLDSEGHSPLRNQFYNAIRKRRKNKKNGTRKELPDESHHSGPCIPGALRLFVNVDGKFYPCERVSENSKVGCIGDIESGISVEKSVELLNVEKVTSEMCHNCWAYSYCSVCIAKADGIESLSEHIVRNNCEIIRREIEESFSDYCFMEKMGYDFECEQCEDNIDISIL